MPRGDRVHGVVRFHTARDVGGLGPVRTGHDPLSLAESLHDTDGLVVLHSARADPVHGRFSFVTANPFLRVQVHGSTCRVRLRSQAEWYAYGDPWVLLEDLLSRYEVSGTPDDVFPRGGCFGYWGYGLRHWVEPKLRRRLIDDLDLPDAVWGFYDSLVVFDHQTGWAHVISTGLQADGSRSARRAGEQADWWLARLAAEPQVSAAKTFQRKSDADGVSPLASLGRDAYIDRIEAAQRYIQAGDIYQVNLARRLTWGWRVHGLELYRKMANLSPAPYAAYLDGGDFQLASASPELFLRYNGRLVTTRPIKGTRPRGLGPAQDEQFADELLRSQKEAAELLMITDLLRNDLGRVCEYGSVRVPELFKLERYAQVQHLVSTITGLVRAGWSQAAALRACFPGGSVTGAPKFRAMEIIEELEPCSRGPYTGCLGYLGFNQASQLSIVIRAAICTAAAVHVYTGAGIVADSLPEAEFEETEIKVSGLRAAVQAVLSDHGTYRTQRVGAGTADPETLRVPLVGRNEIPEASRCLGPAATSARPRASGCADGSSEGGNR